MVVRIQRKLYEYGVLYTINVNVKFIKNPAHIVKYITLPTELSDWIKETDKFVYIGQDDADLWFMSRVPPEMMFKAYAVQKNNQLNLPAKFPEGVIKLDWNCGTDVIWVQTH